MNLYSFPSKTDCTNKFSILKLSENSSLQGSKSTHDDRNHFQVTVTYIEKTGKSLQNTVMMEYDELIFILIKTDSTNKFSIPKLSEHSLFLVSMINQKELYQTKHYDGVAILDILSRKGTVAIVLKCLGIHIIKIVI